MCVHYYFFLHLEAITQVSGLNVSAETIWREPTMVCGVQSGCWLTPTFLEQLGKISDWRDFRCCKSKSYLYIAYRS